MRGSLLRALTAGALFSLAGMLATPVSAKTVAECNADYAANKAAIKASGQTKKEYVATCRTGTDTGAAAPAATPPAAAPIAPTAAGKTVAQCDAEYAANKAAIKAAGQTKRGFVADCRQGTETIPTAAAVPAPAPAPAPASTPITAPAAAPVAPRPRVGATGAGGFTTDAQAHARCPSDTVVWVNTKSRIYHFAGTRNYGSTKQGTYMCESDAKVAGDRAAENETHP